MIKLLQINDIVGVGIFNDKGNKIVRVKEIIWDTFWKERKIVTEREGIDEITYRDRFVHPIDLTTDFLIKNGFKKSEGYLYRYELVTETFEVNITFQRNNEIVRSVRAKSPFGEIRTSNCQFVHLLQHALRSVLIYDLADNLKVKEEKQ